MVNSSVITIPLGIVVQYFCRKWSLTFPSSSCILLTDKSGGEFTCTMQFILSGIGYEIDRSNFTAFMLPNFTLHRLQAGGHHADNTV